MAGKGGARPGAGRKTKAEELKLGETIDNALGENWVPEILKKIHELAKDGSFPHLQLLMNYKFGKPTETHKIDQVSEVIVTFTDGSGDKTDPST